VRIGCVVACRLSGHADPRAGLCKDIRTADLRNTGGWWRLSRLVEVRGGWPRSEPTSTDLHRPPPTSTTLHHPPPTSTNLHQPPSSEAERDRRERDDEEQQRRPREHPVGRGQRPLRIEYWRVTEAAPRQDQHEPAPDEPSDPQRAERDHQQPERERDALVPPRQSCIQNVSAVQLAHG